MAFVPQGLKRRKQKVEKQSQAIENTPPYEPYQPYKYAELDSDPDLGDEPSTWGQDPRKQMPKKQ
jgi:hypothetical protein